MNRLIVILFFILWGNVGSAKADTLMVSQIREYIYVDSFATYSSMPLPDSLHGQLPIIPNDNLYHTLAVNLYNDMDDTVDLFVGVRGNEYWQFNQISATGERYTTQAGAFVPYRTISFPNNRYVVKTSLAPREHYSWTLNTWNISSRDASTKAVYIATARNMYWHELVKDEYHKVPMAVSVFFQGAIWIMMFYMFFLYFQNNRDRAYLYYGLYMMFAMYYLLQKVAGDGPFYFVFGENPMIRYVLNEPVQWMIYFFYNLFVISFLEIQRHSYRLYKFLIGLNVAYVLYLVGESTYFILTFDKEVQSMLFIVSRVIALVISFITIIYIFIVVKGPLVKYIISGSIVFVLSAMLSMFYSLQVSWLPETGLHPISFMQLGILAEILLFSLGLGRRINLMSTEKEEVQQAYIDQLVRNEEIIQESNRDLSEEVFKRTNEIIYKSKELEKEREQKLKTEYEKQLMESEMSTLRLQMNPHFIFNSLNSIRYYILKEDSEKASDYITAFSKLLRMILQHSREKTIKLEDELDALRLYIEFERTRFENKFDYSINVAEDVDVSNIPIQPLLIQPFVENSIWHGLLHKDGTGHLNVEVFMEGAFLTVIVEDDGIGRRKSREYNSAKSSTYKSMGMQITKDRLRMMAKVQNADAGYEIVDMVDAEGSAAGTKVILKIKVL
ncbi:histidine kinase [Owenweeksia hongkongensis]|nr:histidine kinase [Owenweeksia hongkongensis]